MNDVEGPKSKHEILEVLDYKRERKDCRYRRYCQTDHNGEHHISRVGYGAKSHD